jgi:hypothetical protein
MAHEHEHAGELFPREQTTELVGQAEERRARRERLEPWAIGAGLAALALGLPSERLWGNVWSVPEHALGHAGLGALVRWAAEKLALSAERGWFLVSAFAFGLSVPALTRLLERMGFEHRVALGATLVALIGPLGWIAATLPGPFHAGVLGAILLATALVRGPLDGTFLRWSRGAAFALLACWLHPQNLLLFPAVLLALSRRAPARAPRLGETVRACLFLALALGLALAILSTVRTSEAREALLRVLLAGRSGGPLEILEWSGFLVLGLGLASVGLHALFVARRAPEESPPPRWLAAWCGVALVPIVAGAPAWAPLLPWLLVAAAMGVADWTARAASGGPRLAGALAGQLLLTALATWVFSATDPERAWREHARGALERGDLVLTSDPSHAYLLGERWELDTRLLAPSLTREEGERALSPNGGARVVLDGSLESLPENVRPLLVERGVVPLERLDPAPRPP